MGRQAYTVIFACAILVIAAPWIGVYYCGERCQSFIQTVNGKIVLGIAIDCAILVFVLQLYLYYVPASAIRQTRSSINLCKAAIAASFILPWGFYIAVNTKIYDTNFTIKFDEAGLASAFALATCWVMLYFLNIEYNKLRRPENLSWAMAE